MTNKVKWTIIAVGIVLVAIVAIWIGGKLGLIAGGGGILALIGMGRKKPIQSNMRDDIADLVDAGLQATEERNRVEQERESEKAAAEVSHNHKELEEKANAPCDDPTAWTRDG